MSDVWYRGQSSILPPSRPGGASHDFGDALYFADTRAVAELYASTRVKLGGGGTPQVFHVTLPQAQLGRVLDLMADSRWETFVNTPMQNSNRTPLSVIRRQHELYGQFFQDFVSKHRIDLTRVDVVIGPEYVRGGLQMAILHKNGAPSQLAQEVRLALRPIGDAPQLPVRNQQTVSGGTKPPANSQPERPGNLGYDFGASGSRLIQTGFQKAGIINNQAAVGMLGDALAGIFSSANDWAIRRNVEAQLSGQQAGALESILQRGDGVLVIIRLEQWAVADFNGTRMRRLHSVSLQGGKSQQSALTHWQSMPRLFAGADKGWLAFEEYIWISPRL